MLFVRQGRDLPQNLPMDWRDLEGVAREFVEATGVVMLPMDLDVLAHCYDLRVVRAASGGVVGQIVLAPDRETRERSRFALAHELGHIAVAHLELSRSEEEVAAHYVAGAILVPESPMRDLMRRTEHSLRALVDAAGVSWEAAARRYVQVWSAYATIWDSSHRVRRVPSPWLADRPIATVELDNANACRVAREDIKQPGQSGTYYVGGPAPHERVVGLWALDELDS